MKRNARLRSNLILAVESVLPSYGFQLHAEARHIFVATDKKRKHSKISIIIEEFRIQFGQ